MRPIKHFIYTQLLLQSATGRNYNTHQRNYEINLYNFEVSIIERCVVWVSILSCIFVERRDRLLGDSESTQLFEGCQVLINQKTFAF